MRRRHESSSGCFLFDYTRSPRENLPEFSKIDFLACPDPFSQHSISSQINQIIGETVRRIRQNKTLKKFAVDASSLILVWLSKLDLKVFHTNPRNIGIRVYITFSKNAPIESHYWFLNRSIDDMNFYICSD